MTFTYCPVRSNTTDTDIAVFLDEVLSVPDEVWHYNTFRNCKMLGFYNPQGIAGQYELSRKGAMAFSKEAQAYCPRLIDYLHHEVLSWMKPHGRVTILRTPAHTTMKEHIDCALSEVGTIQHKWRLALHGDIGGLYFIDENLNHVHVNSNHRCYVLDGGHPHSISVSAMEKITVCIGSPWRNQVDDPAFTNRLLVDEALYVSRPAIDLTYIEDHLRIDGKT